MASPVWYPGLTPEALWMVRPREANAMMELMGRPEADKPAAPKAPKAEWEVGAKVTHAKFGEGTITSLTGSGAEAKLGVKFSSGAKTLLAKFLTRVA